jgi:hypothetical protein
VFYIFRANFKKKNTACKLTQTKKLEVISKSFISDMHGILWQMASLQESLNRFKQQQEKCQSTLKSISRATASSSNAKAPQQQPQKKPHTAAPSSLTAKPVTPIKFSNDTERLQHINTIRKSSHGRRMKLVIDLLFEVTCISY